jgi:glycosyltransferase involved in cell wall biosynthesis
MVGQRELARHMQRASVLLMPNPWPETSCIALIEGLASGLSAVITNRAALPETAAGFARQIPIDDPDDQTRFDMPLNYDAFAAAVLDILRQRDEQSDQMESELRRQIDHFHTHYQWRQRVSSWANFIKKIS